MWFNGELFEIFSWLPANYLYNFSTVCTSLNQLLFDRSFIKKQCKNMQLVGDTHFLLHDGFPRKLELHAISSNNSSRNRSFESNILPCGSLDFVIEQGNSVLASSNGLLCCRNVNNNEYPLFLFNPTTRNYLPIPTPYETIKSDSKIDLIFACDHGEEEENFGCFLMVVEADEWNTPLHSKIYSPEENIWRDGGRINIGPRNIWFKYSVKNNGVIYMISDLGSYLLEDGPGFWPYIVAYDINNSTSRFFQIPIGATEEITRDMDLRIFKWGTNPNNSLNPICLVKLCDNVFSLWVLNNCDVEETNSCSYCWRRVMEMPIKAMGSSSLTDDVKVTGFTVLNGGVLLFATDKKVYSYNIANWSNVEKVEEVCEHGRGDNVLNFRPFSSALRPCGPDAITLPLHEF